MPPWEGERAKGDGMREERSDRVLERGGDGASGIEREKISWAKQSIQWFNDLTI